MVTLTTDFLTAQWLAMLYSGGDHTSKPSELLQEKAEAETL